MLIQHVFTTTNAASQEEKKKGKLIVKFIIQQCKQSCTCVIHVKSEMFEVQKSKCKTNLFNK